MYIIDRRKDYYDYLSHIYGTDKQVIYDRRQSVEFDETDFVDRLSWNMRKFNPTFILEVGFTQYLFEVEDIKREKIPHDPALREEVVSYNLVLLHTFKNFEHHYSTPLSIHEVEVNYRFHWDNGHPRQYVITNNYKETIKPIRNPKIIEYPILAGTKITSFISPDDIWKDLQTYISSLNNDKDVTLDMTDKEKAEIHGFDKTAFRKVK